MAYQTIYEEKYIPDMSTWTNIGTNPFCYSRIVKINNTLYAYGCIINNVQSTKIYSTAWNNPTGWADTGVSVAGFAGDSCIAILNDTIYCYTDWSAGGHILTAPVSAPLTWTNTNLHVLESRDNCAFIVTPTNVYFCGGYKGSATLNMLFAPVTTPTTFDYTHTAISGWEQGGCYLDDTLIYMYGGYSPTSIVYNVLWRTPAKNPTISTALITPATAPQFVTGQDPATFHVENRVYITGAANANLYHVSDNRLHTKWDVYTSVMPGNVGYPHSNWIGPDGYAYMILNHASAPPIYRSGRKKIYVIDPPGRNGTYVHRRAITETGGNSKYTIHCQMGMAPWYTNRRDKF
jgi:hypothetical protein